MGKIKVILSAMVLGVIFSAYSQAYTEDSKVFMLGIGLGGGTTPNTVYVENPSPTGNNNLVHQASGGYDLKMSPVIIALNYQHGIHEYISVGGYLSSSFSTADLKGVYSDYNYEVGDYDNDGAWDDRYTKLRYETRRMTSLYYGLKVEGHFSELIGLIDELDLYAGVSLGANTQIERVYNIKNSDVYEYDVNSSGTPDSFTESNTEVDSYSWSTSGGVGTNVFIGARYYLKDNLGAYLEFGVGYAQIGLTVKL